jgi:CheY-like chemotaxis protein
MANAFSVAIVDDNEMKRDTFRDELELADWIAMPLAGPFACMQALLDKVIGQSNAAICDHHLHHNYAAFDGAETVATLYQKKFPAVLVTQYERALMDDIRPHRRGIPVLLTPAEANPDSLVRGWEICKHEFEGKFGPSRMPWRAMLRIDDVDDAMVYALLPGWNSDEIIKFPISIMPLSIRQQIKPGTRLFAQVNKGAEDQSELFFENFELGGA